METVSSVSIALAGSGGAGVMTAGNALLEAAARAGSYGVMSRSSGPQIRGGEAAAMLRLSTAPVQSPDDRFQLLVAIDWRNVERFADEIPLDSNSLVIGDADAGSPPAFLDDAGLKFCQVPFKRLAKRIPGGRANMVALGVLGALVGVPARAVDAVVGDTLRAKGTAAVDAGRRAAAEGYRQARELPTVERLALRDRTPGERMLITGNEAVGLGAVRGGIRFVAAYPITPATEILEWMAPAVAEVGGTLVQAEDELASVNQIIGASFGGTPALTATSGPGLALMLESIGLAVASEVPVVVVDVMRGGPSTGIPTKSEQSDLNMALYGLPGSAPHLVLAPTSVADCLFTTQWAVHLAERLQTPAIVLSDQSLGQTRAVIERPPNLAFFAQREIPDPGLENYRRYALTASGVSPMAIPGTHGGQYTAEGLEHDPKGIPSSQAHDHHAQLDKRERKLTAFNYGQHWAEIDGDGDTAVITWGSSTAPVREALGRLRAAGRPVRLVTIRLLSPPRPDALAAALSEVERVLVVEQSHDAQFLAYLRAHYQLPGCVDSLCRPGPLPIRPHEVCAKLSEVS